MLATPAARDRLGIQHQVTLSALWLGLNFQSSALLPIVVPAQVLLLIDRGGVASPSQATITALGVEERPSRYGAKSARSTVAR